MYVDFLLIHLFIAKSPTIWNFKTYKYVADLKKKLFVHFIKCLYKQFPWEMKACSFDWQSLLISTHLFLARELLGIDELPFLELSDYNLWQSSYIYVFRWVPDQGVLNLAKPTVTGWMFLYLDPMIYFLLHQQIFNLTSDFIFSGISLDPII